MGRCRLRSPSSEPVSTGGHRHRGYRVIWRTWGRHPRCIGLTVTDNGTPAAAASTTVEFVVIHGLDAQIAVSAKLPDPRAIGHEGDVNELYTVEAVIDGPVQGGNAGNEWDIKEGARLVIEASARSEVGGSLPASAISWERVHISPDSGTVTSTSLPNSAAGALQLVAHRSVGFLTNGDGRESDPFFVYYRASATEGQRWPSAMPPVRPRPSRCPK